MLDLLRLDAPVDIRAAGAARTPRITILAYSGGPIMVPNYGNTVIDLSGLDFSRPVQLLAEHEASIDGLLGSGEAETRGGELWVTGTLTRANPRVERLVAMAADGTRFGASVGVEPLETAHVREGDRVSANGRTFTAPRNGLTFVRRGLLRETSIVALAADAQSTVSIAARAASHQTRRNLLMPQPDSHTPEHAASVRAELDALAAGASPAERILGIWNRNELSPEHRPAAQPLLTAALAGKITTDEFELELLRRRNAELEVEQLRAARPKAPPVMGSRSGQGDLQAVLTASLCAQAGLSDATLKASFPEHVLDAATRPEYRHVGLQETLLRAACDNGYQAAPGQRLHEGNLRGVLEAAFLKGAFSTHQITTMLTDLGHKVLLDGFNRVPQRWREVATIRTVSDFKQTTAFRMTADLEYAEVAPAGEIEHGALGQESYTMQARTYAKMLTLTRTDLINDDLGAFNDLRNRLGIGAAVKLNKEFWTCWLAASAGGAFWTGARGNLSAGAGSALDEAGLNAAVKLFRDAVASDGNLLDLEPDRILVPSDLEATAKRWFSSTEIRDTTDSTRTPTANIFAGRFRPIVVPQLSNAAYTGNSSTAWWLLADPALLASASVCFLDGRETPVIESADADFNVLGIQFRGYHDFGVQMSEWRASVKSAGA